MRRRSPARWLAPLALVTCAVAIYAVVDQELLSDGGSATTSSTSTSTAKGGTTSTSTAKRKTTKKAKTVTVKAGDSLSTIADKAGVTVEDLTAANPDVDASALHPGQKLKLPR
jgi:LysM repeat protein